MAAARHNYNTDNFGQVHARDNLAATAAEMGSRNLLVAQLRYGQHALGPDAFWDRVRALREGRYL